MTTLPPIRHRDRSLLHPRMLPILDAHEAAAATSPIVGPVSLIETWRERATQDADFARGRDSAGRVVDASQVVTAKRGGASWHNMTRRVRVCPDCPHLAERHLSRDAVAGAARTCSLCACVAHPERLMRGETTEVAASLAYHLAVRCRGCHPSGTLVGFGAHATIVKGSEDEARYLELAVLGESLGLRAGVAWGDYSHFEVAGLVLSQVVAALQIVGGDLTWPRTA